MNFFQFLSHSIIKKSFHFSVLLIERFSDLESVNQKAAELCNLPEGSLGKDIANCLDENGLRLIPKFESHDLKHVLLGYKMTPIDEIRLQAFMLGNGNWSIPSIAIMLFGATLLPGRWPVFFQDFKNGRRTKPISTWSINDFENEQTAFLRKCLFEKQASRQPVFSLEKISKCGAVVSILAGIFGMVFCLPFLFSSNLADLVGAGFPFVGGAVLTVGGLLVLSNLAKQEPIVYQV